jgi:nucleoside-diphosphate-sugar epimerase
MRVLVTGATGFIGGAILAQLALERGIELRGTVRHNTQGKVAGAYTLFDGDLTPDTDWRQAMSEVNIIVHTAARVHVMQDLAPNPLDEFRRINVAGTLNLARQAAVAGVQRFIFVSSIKVNGECTSSGRPFTAADEPAPVDFYGISKHEAEIGLRKISQETGVEVVIIRPVLVYGPSVKGNFLSMVRWLYRGVPLPFGAIHNQRSLLALDNLVDLIVTCLNSPAAANQTFLAADGHDLSTTELLKLLRDTLGSHSHLFPLPVRYIEMGAKLVGKSSIAQRLCSSLQVDISKTKKLLAWQPVISVEEGLRRVAIGFLNEKKSC